MTAQPRECGGYGLDHGRARGTVDTRHVAVLGFSREVANPAAHAQGHMHIVLLLFVFAEATLTGAEP